MKSAREYLKEDLAAAIHGDPPEDDGPPMQSVIGYPGRPPGPPSRMAPPGMMPGYYPVSTQPLSPYVYPAMGNAEAPVPFYKKPLVTFAAGALLVGGAWFWFGFLRSRMGKGGKK
jgi:hypothetical protein